MNPTILFGPYLTVVMLVYGQSPCRHCIGDEFRHGCVHTRQNGAHTTWTPNSKNLNSYVELDFYEVKDTFWPNDFMQAWPGVHFTWGEGQDTGPRDTWNLHPELFGN